MRQSTVAAAFAAILAGTGAAHADTFTESVQFGPGLTDSRNATGTTAGPGGNTLYLFDSDGGTLNSITFSYSYGITSDITVTAFTDSTGSVRTQSAPQFGSSNAAVTTALNNTINNYVDPIDGTTLTFGTATLSPIAADVRGINNIYVLAAGMSQRYSSTGSYSRASFVDTSASDLAAFSVAGGGLFTPLLTTLTGLIQSANGGNAFATQSTTAQGNLTLTYNYTASSVPTPTVVPEPLSVSLLLLPALAGVVAHRRRRAG